MATKQAKQQPVANKTPEFEAAKKALQAYFKENGLDPTKDYSKDKKHGKAISKLIRKFNLERDKLAMIFPESDDREVKRIKDKAKKKAIAELKVDKLQKHLKEEEKAEKAEKKKVTKYDYPLVDGREMTPDEKKRYRVDQRKLLKAQEEKAKDNASSAEPNKGKKKDKEKVDKKKKKKLKV